ncbi:pyridoxamine 5'-phosphate oxidase family protein [Streptacidiphilus sp. ASG 303]|uniref:pyridoxamine 5'-phosphate oxidase family protein n=1 Tax=Streptacidiphilus sp. ASG 303 TaxID=2896847 RepID=UPI001E5F252F|nr:pyridoxamine 5'-phosphate oxidase family protein [Streptacidiphilus sp. ASG 303]MCD0484123.1 pyridoxamine 5'-phosphate oxidase family protein [Streptacidiphilus sp. ASG 303]
MTDGLPPPAAGYHGGELSAQERAGFRPSAARMLPMVAPALPRGAVGFLAAQRVLFVGAADTEGRVWASVLHGDPGFLRVRDPGTLEIAALPAAVDPLAVTLRSPARTGTLAIDFRARRRFRMNGRTAPAGHGLLLAVDQAYGNCPRYIQSRTPGEAPPGAPARLLSAGDALDEGQRRLVATADTFLVASVSADGDADVSHRGGNPGFVRVEAPDRLSWPDYDGNTMLMTLGNLTAHPAAGLLFVDWRSGTALHLTGTATVDWDPEAAAGVPGAQRIVRFAIARVVQVDHPEAPSWSPPHFSRFNPPVADRAG